MNIKYYFNKLINWIFSKEIFCILKNNGIFSHQLENLKIESITYSNLDSILDIDSQNYILKYKDFLQHKNKGFIAYYNGECCHRALEVKGPTTINVFNNYKLSLKTNENYIHYCKTKECFRGKSIYPNVLKYICSQNPNQTFYLMALARKKSALKGAQKGGFVIVKVIKSFKIFGISFFKTIYTREKK